MVQADLSPRFKNDDNHIIHLSTRIACKRGVYVYRGLGCFVRKCIHPEFNCSHCVCSFSSLSPFK